MNDTVSVHLMSFSHTLFQSCNLLNCFFNAPPTKMKVKAGGIGRVYQRRKDHGGMSTAEDFCHRPGEARGPAGSSAPSDSSELKKHFKVRDIDFFFLMSILRKMYIFMKNWCPDLWHERLCGRRNPIKWKWLEEQVESRVGAHSEALDKFIVICPEPSPGRHQVGGFGL